MLCKEASEETWKEGAKLSQDFSAFVNKITFQFRGCLLVKFADVRKRTSAAISSNSTSLVKDNAGLSISVSLP